MDTADPDGPAGARPEPGPRVTVVVPAYKRTEMVRMALGSLLAQDLEPDAYEVIVVDSSPDGANLRLVAALAREAPCALRCWAKPAEGPGPSRNLGARQARGEIVAFMDSDCQAAPGWLRAGLAAFAEGVGLVQGRTLGDPAGTPGIFTWHVEVEEENFIYECANIFYRRAAFEQAGGFGVDLTPRAETPMGGEDVELAWRVKRLGWTSRFARDAVVYHALVPITPWRWLFSKRLFIWPRLKGAVPELRPFFVWGCFLDRAQAGFALGLAGTALAWATPLALVAWAPYAAIRASEPTRTLRGPLRLLRVLLYAPRDALAFLVLLAGSIRFRSLLL
ncbi:MAG: glycosyltransferase [Candidatus Rokubacteria bacterium]|nr:glycosyltransferase [Candidatus Rokubacteria bacterium]